MPARIDVPTPCFHWLFWTRIAFVAVRAFLISACASPVTTITGEQFASIAASTAPRTNVLPRTLSNCFGCPRRDDSPAATMTAAMPLERIIERSLAGDWHVQGYLVTVSNREYPDRVAGGAAHRHLREVWRLPDGDKISECL